LTTVTLLKEFVMKFKLNAVASVCLLGTLLGCAQWMPGAPLVGFNATPSRGQASAIPVKVAPMLTVAAALPSVDAVFAMGRSAHGAGQLLLAGQRYAEVLKMAPDHVGALNALAVIYAQSDRIDEALALFRRASDLTPDAAHVYNNIGYALLRADRLDEAEVALQRARALDPANVMTQQNLALVATGKAARQAMGSVVQPDAAHDAGPHLVVVAPNVFELQAPTSTATDETGRDQGHAADLPAKDSAVANVQAKPAIASMSVSAELHGVRLEVSNGVGITRLARRTADRLATEGVVTARLTNAQPYQQAKTEIQFVKGQALAAQALQSHLPVATLAVPASRLSAGVQVRLVLGHDMAGRAIAEWLDAVDKPQVATTMQGGWRWS
jgi:hypothetical protein